MQDNVDGTIVLHIILHLIFAKHYLHRVATMARSGMERYRRSDERYLCICVGVVGVWCGSAVKYFVCALSYERVLVRQVLFT